VRDPLLPLYRIFNRIDDGMPSANPPLSLVVMMVAVFPIMGLLNLLTSTLAPQAKGSIWLDEHWAGVGFGIIGAFIVYSIGRSFWDGIMSSSSQDFPEAKD